MKETFALEYILKNLKKEVLRGTPIVLQRELVWRTANKEKFLLLK